MASKRITAFVRESQVSTICEALREQGINGLSLIPIRGFGEYENDYNRDGLVDHIKIEIYIKTEHVQHAVSIIINLAHTGLSGDGIIAVSDVDALYRIRTKQLMDG